ncbi:type II toxin-antitoxin system RelE/ParE family toxin [Methylocystis bryophila]|uniref:Plasmid stabilization protein n=1 Tax=Methylocystis bryophila TaxID=655015 RepID=A0A1W6MVT3_9HYPH|nr:type II toxin-antitoxin system RelE/ParE family toxin [Methylocystis bryophila]ARN81710.1 hypothetical protein B1812_12195 [Methylocystis bryophila]BDV37760.1 hypothetical protein DSM21852_10130 [Methylocystis bryophila]
MTGYRLSPEAEKDVHFIRLYLTKNGGARVARYVLRELRQAIRLLAERPEIGHSRADLTDAPVKFWSVFSYLIIYDPVSTPLSVVRVLHGRRDVEHDLAEALPNSKSGN